MNKIVHISELPLEEQEWFLKDIKYVIVCDGTPITGYKSKEIAETDFDRMIEEYNTYLML